MNVVWIALGAAFLAVAMSSYGRARRETSRESARAAHLTAALSTVAAIAFFVAGALTAWKGA